MRSLAAAHVLAFCLAGCTGRVWTDAATADAIRLRWYTRETTIDAARSKAEAHCQGVGKQAALGNEFEDGDVTVATFACR